MTASPTEKAILVGVEISSHPGLLALDDSLNELELLSQTAGLKSIGRLTQKLETPQPATLIGTGKVQELSDLVISSAADVVIFDDELSPRQQREIEEVLGENVKVIDRTALILDIFARHARTREGAVQVELAQYEYRLPRLTRAWTHLARQAGGRAGGASGGVGVRGPGETQLEVDRREIDRRIAFLKRQLDEIQKQRRMHREQRKQTATPVVALVGYTNAGKSTLLNAIAKSDVLAMDRLFATLDPTTRRMLLPSKQAVLFTDTVGFIQKLPTQLVAAFRATLEEVTEADILLHVVDLSHPNMDEQVAAVEEVLEELGAGSKTVITALNKVDRITLDDPEQSERLQAALVEYPHAVAISALTGAGLQELADKIDEVIRMRMAPIDVVIPYRHGELVALMHEHGFIDQEEHGEHGTHIVGRIPYILAGRYIEYRKS
ncbi:MAG: GTPase HflX [Caldilineaceae bacterium]